MEIIKNPATVEDRDLARAYKIALKFFAERGFKVKKVRMGISPFAPTHKKSMIVEISPSPEHIVNLVHLKQDLQKRIGKKVGVTLV
ncbi:hypothetical protein [Desulfurobacterium sp.]